MRYYQFPNPNIIIQELQIISDIKLATTKITKIRLPYNITQCKQH